MNTATKHHRPAATLRLLAGLMVAALIAAVAPASPSDGRAVRVIVEAASHVSAAAEAVTAAGGRVEHTLGSLGLLVGEVPGDRVDELRTDPRAVSVSADRPMEVQADSFTSSEEPPAAFQTVGLPEVWASGHTGAGVGIALVDTGISAHPDLAGRVVAAFDLSGEDTPHDGYGHGTFLAGVAAGDGAASGGRYPGAAPDAHLVSIKVAGADGATTLSQVLHGLEVAGRSADDLGVRVVALALSGPAGPVRDPLQVALERLWRQGLFVVVAAGNSGPEPGSVGSPGVDPYVLTVGATDDAGTRDPADDSVPAWSAVGPTPAGFAKPDLVAPGTRIVAARAVDSVIDRTFPDARIGEHYLRGSGTSMAAALTAGAAAVVLQAQPHLAPDEVKGRLMFTTDAAPAGSDPAAVGEGVLDVPAAVSTITDPANVGLPQAAAPAGTGGAGGGAPTALEATGWRWAGDDWTGWRWAGDDWTGWRWAGDDWTGWRWAGFVEPAVR